MLRSDSLPVRLDGMRMTCAALYVVQTKLLLPSKTSEVNRI